MKVLVNLLGGVINMDWEELRFVDYCNNCKTHSELGMEEYFEGEFDPCHHYWYCWNDGGEVQELQMQILYFENMMKYRRLYPHEFKTYHGLLRRRNRLVNERLSKAMKELLK